MTHILFRKFHSQEHTNDDLFSKKTENKSGLFTRLSSFAQAVIELNTRHVGRQWKPSEGIGIETEWIEAKEEYKLMKVMNNYKMQNVQYAKV
jgi:hypothetical protein